MTKQNLKMNKIYMAAAVVTLCACTQKPMFTVEGTVEGATDSLLYLEHIALSGRQTLDSVKLESDGHFSFQAEATTGAPEFYNLRIYDQIINFAVDSTETITIKAQYPNMAARYEVSGEDNERIQELSLLQQDLLRRAIVLDGDRSLLPDEKVDSLQRMMHRYKENVAWNFIYQHPEEASSYFALHQTLGPWLIFDPNADGIDQKCYAAVANSWQAYYPESERTKSLYALALKNIEDHRLIAARQQATAVHEPVIEESGVINLRLPDKNRQERTLTELKGRVVLLDFHTFTMKESPQRVLMLRDLYNKYHDQGLEIYQVALDADEHFWLQKTAELPWICVRDESGQSAVNYNVMQLPEYFLIDRQNQLQKRSSQMTDLEEEIKRLLSF